MSVTSRFIGSGITFPIELNAVTRKPVIYDDLKLIRSSIAVILNWETRTRWFNERFGSRIHEVLEEPDDSIARALLIFFVKQAISDWENRVYVADVKISDTTGDGRIDLAISYGIRNTKIEETQIFPFYSDLKY